MTVKKKMTELRPTQQGLGRSSAEPMIIFNSLQVKGLFQSCGRVWHTAPTPVVCRCGAPHPFLSVARSETQRADIFATIGSHQMRGKDGNDDRRGWGQDPRRLGNARDTSCILQHHAPTGRWFRKPEAEIRKRRFGEHKRWK